MQYIIMILYDVPAILRCCARVVKHEVGVMDCSFSIFRLLFTFFLILLIITFSSAEKKPNILILVVDDLGVADLGCFGNDSLKTPNIDKLASEGARLTHNLAPESVCTPSRAAFLTGRYALRSGFASNPGKTRVYIHTAASGGMPRNETTFAEVLAQAGYTTGLIGKWHLGLNLKTANDFHFHPLKQGFQYFYGVPLSNIHACEPQQAGMDFLIPNLKSSAAITLLGSIAVTTLLGQLSGLIKIRFLLLLLFLISSFYALLVLIDYSDIVRNFTCFLMRDYKVVEQPVILENLTARFTNDAIKFIERSKKTAFMLYMSYTKVHTPLFTMKAFQGHSKHSRYGDNVEEVDWSIGKIIGALEHLGIRDNTFVYFTSDHGPHLEKYSKDGEYEGGWKGIYRGGKGQSWEGGIRVPTIVSWPSHIQTGIEISEPTNNFDIFPTVLHIAGASVPHDRIIDGKNIMPLLKQQEQYSPHGFMYHYCAKAIHAVRYRPRHGYTTWKVHFMTPRWTEGIQGCMGRRTICMCYDDNVFTHDPPLLFNITGDPSESHPVRPSNPHYKAVMEDVMTAVQKHNESINEVPNQLEYNNWYPWLQQCCNFPFCKCIENQAAFMHFP